MNDEQKELAAVVGAAVASALQQAPPKAEVPPALKWAGVLVSALLTMAIAGSGAWLINTVNAMQITLTRVDERSLNDVQLREQRDDDFDRRLQAVEGRMPHRSPFGDTFTGDKQ
jgi:hypothetical protein